MTTGFQQQHQAYCAIVRAVAKPQHVGAQLTVKDPAV